MGTISPMIELGAGFDMDLTARENIFLNGSVLGYSKQMMEDKFDEILEFSELQPFVDVAVKNYSSGMVARLAFAIATITKPDILIVDEEFWRWRLLVSAEMRTEDPGNDGLRHHGHYRFP